MTNSEKIEYLKQQPKNNVCLPDYYQDMLYLFGDIKKNYADYMVTEPIDCNTELKRLVSADYDLCCALLTMLLRADHFAQYGCFESHVKNGDVPQIIRRMIKNLEKREMETERRLAGRAAEFFMDDE